MGRYSFVVRGATKNSPDRLKVVNARNFRKALSKVLSLFPNKFIHTSKTTKQMDLISARVEAATLSKNGKTIYINADSEGECSLSEKPGKDCHGVYRNGSELKTDVAEAAIEQIKSATLKKAEASVKAPKVKTPAKKSTTKTEKEMETVVKTPAKKTAKKSPAKKVTAKKEAPKKILKPAKKAEGDWHLNSAGETPRGCNMYLTPAEWKKLDSLLAKEETSFNKWVKGLIKSKLK